MEKLFIEQLYSEFEEQWTCPITRTAIKDPVFTTDGHIYEQSAIQEWFKNSNISPKTGLPLSSKDLITCIPFRQLQNKILTKWPLLIEQFKSFQMKISLKNDQIKLLNLKLDNQCSQQKQNTQSLSNIKFPLHRPGSVSSSMNLAINKIQQLMSERQGLSNFILNAQTKKLIFTQHISQIQFKKLQAQMELQKIQEQFQRQRYFSGQAKLFGKLRNKIKQKTLKNLQQQVTNKSLKLVQIQCEIGNNYYNQGKFTQALQIYQEGRKFCVQLNKQITEQQVSLLGNIGNIYCRLNRFSESIKKYQNGLQMLQILNKQNTEKYVIMLRNIAHLKAFENKYEDTLIYLLKAQQTMSNIPTTTPINLSFIYHEMSTVYNILERKDEAMLNINKAIKIRIRQMGENNSLMKISKDLQRKILLDDKKEGKQKILQTLFQFSMGLGKVNQTINLR